MTSAAPVCPRCGPELERVPGAGYRCDTCAGEAVAVALLRRTVDGEALNRLWQAARSAPEAGVTCPSCGHPMTALELLGAELDVCTTCQWVWLDAGEAAVLPARAEETPPPGSEEAELPPEAREAMRRLRLHHDGTQQRSTDRGTFLADVLGAAFRWWP